MDTQSREGDSGMGFMRDVLRGKAMGTGATRMGVEEGCIGKERAEGVDGTWDPSVRCRGEVEGAGEGGEADDSEEAGERPCSARRSTEMGECATAGSASASDGPPVDSEERRDPAEAEDADEAEVSEAAGEVDGLRVDDSACRCLWWWRGGVYTVEERARVAADHAGMTFGSDAFDSG